MNQHLESIPLLMTVALQLVMVLMSVTLYKRWRHKTYFFLLASAAAATVFFLFIFLLSLRSVGLSSSANFAFSLSSLIFVITQASFFHYLLPKSKDMVKYYAGATGLIVILGGSSFFSPPILGNLLIGIGWLGAAALLWFTAIPKLPKFKKFQYALIFFSISSLIYLIPFQFDSKLVFLFSFQFFAYMIMQHIFIDRVIDTVEAVSYQSVTDGLTGLYNKNFFIRKVSEHLGNGTGRALIFVDIDNFKKLNDTQGHAMGDQLLKLVARELYGVFSPVGFTGRYGGEEMVALITNGKSDPAQLAEEFRNRVMEASADLYPITVSVGYSCYQEHLTPAELIAQADEAMYLAKSNGKNQVFSYTHD